jgi:hypothetical protein
MKRKTSVKANRRKRPAKKAAKKAVAKTRMRIAKATPARKARPVPGRKRTLAWEPTPEAQKVIDTCQDVFDNTSGASSDCNKFVKAVCDKFSVNPFASGDDADDITNDIRDSTWLATNGWTGLDKDPVKAKSAADEGKLVIAGATGSDLGQNHGHVVVVVSSESLWKNYPYGSWGTLGGVGKTNAKMTLAYKLADLPKVSYMSKAV